MSTNYMSMLREWHNARDLSGDGYDFRYHPRFNSIMRRGACGSISVGTHMNTNIRWFRDNTCEITGNSKNGYPWHALPASCQYNPLQQVVHAKSGYIEDGARWRCNPLWHIARCTRHSSVVIGSNGHIIAESVKEMLPNVTVNRRLARQVSQDYRLTDFEKWFDSVTALMNVGEDERLFEGAGAHDHEKRADLLHAIKYGDFREAAQLLPRVDTTAFGRARNGRSWAMCWQVTRSSIDRLRQELYQMHGVTQIEMLPTLSRSQYNRARKLGVL